MPPQSLGQQILAELQTLNTRLAALEQRVGLGERTWLTPVEMCRVLNIHRRTLQYYVTRGKLPENSYRREPRGTCFTYRFHRERVLRALGML